MTPSRRVLALSVLAFLWTFAWGVIWIWTGARNEPDRWKMSVLCGFFAVAPAVLGAFAILGHAGLQLWRGKPASYGAITFSIGTLCGGLLMNAMALSIFLDYLFPPFFAHGRRLHRGKEILSPGATAGAGWVEGALEVDVPEELRAGLAAQWRENGSKEHASIAAFAQLTLDLIAVGAPARLVAAVQADAADEVRHAGQCYAVAAAIDGVVASPAPFPEAREHRTLPARREHALAQLALEALADGVLNEGIAARLLARTALGAKGELRALLHGMAADEARHAKDSWDVLAWCVAEGGPLVRAALAKVELPAQLGSPLPEGARDGAWIPWGVQSVALEASEYTIVRRQTAARLDELLG